MSGKTYRVDVQEVAERVLSRPVGAFRVSIIEIRALALFVVQQTGDDQPEENETEEETEDERTD